MRIKNKYYLFLVGLILLQFFQIDYAIGIDEGNITSEHSSLELSSQKEVEEIRLNGVEEFLTNVELNNWQGDGTKASPYIIEGYRANFVYISNTSDIYFIFQNNTVESSSKYFDLPRMILSNVTGAIVRSNTISSNLFGILLQSTKLSEISENTITITGFSSCCTSYGIFLQNLENAESFGNIIRRNYIDSYGSGIILLGDNNFVDSNHITYTKQDQWGGSWGHGIHVISNRNEITRNTISYKYGYGILLENSHNNNITKNNFVSNSLSLSQPTYSYQNQAGDYKFAAVQLTNSNYFEGNFWSEWNDISSDLDGDNTLDDPYLIDNNWGQIEDSSPSKLLFLTLPIDEIGNKISEDSEVKGNQVLYLPLETQILIGILFSLSAALAYYFVYLPRIKDETLHVSKTIAKEISSVFHNRPSLLYLILSQKNNNPTPTEEELRKSIPIEIFGYKFLMHPVRLAMTKLLFETIELTSIEMKNSLDLSWGDYSSHIKALVKQDYIYIREEFREGSVKQVLTLTDLGHKSYDELKSILFDFLSNSPESYLNYVDKHYSDKINFEEEGT
ncbi:MAG: hypothetical protein GPJ54_07200 [Candidatus Heimdallarchaeota archaeon]|nr:hypothetical protein [Candidatus Heimdallarchaeota archaeon]